MRGFLLYSHHYREISRTSRPMSIVTLAGAPNTTATREGLPLAGKSDRKSDRRHQQGLESQQRILEAAFEIAAERGYDGMTLSQVTKRAGIPPSSVYWHFENKDELLAEALEYNYRNWRALRTGWIEAPTGGTLDDQVEFALRQLAIGLEQQPEFQRLGLMLALERRVVEVSARARFKAIRDETREQLASWWVQTLPSSNGEP